MASKEVIIDTGFFLAIFSKNDQFHGIALEVLKTINQKKWITTWPVLTEVCHLLMSKNKSFGIPQLLQMYEKGGYEIFSLSVTHTPRLLNILEKYKSLPMDLADASLVILAETLGHGNIVSTDARDFATYKWKNNKPFHNLFKSCQK